MNNFARNERNNFGNGPRITTINLPDQVINQPVPQTGVTENKEETPFLSTTDGSNPFLAERVASIGGVV